ncbi:MAG: YcaO-like family protein [Chitinophagaceae bacterium]
MRVDKTLPAFTKKSDAAEQLRRLLARVHDIETGLIRFITEIPLQPDEPALHLAVAEYQDPFLVPPRSLDIGTSPIPETSLMGAGAALDRVSALWSAVGEAIERYALHVYDREEIIFARCRDMGLPCVTPDQMILFSQRQYSVTGFSYVRYNPEDRIGWTRGIDLRTGDNVWLPAVLSYLAYRPLSPVEHLDSGYSTGAAAGPSEAAAFHAGLLEVIERDGFACHWYLRRTPPEIDIGDYLGRLPPRLIEIINRAKVCLRFFDITTDLGVPTVLAIGLPKAGGIAIGASARPSFAGAIEKAAVEAFHTWNWITDLRRNQSRIDDRGQIRSYRDHVVWYLDPTRAAAVDFILDAPRPERLPVTEWQIQGDEERLAALVTMLSEAGYAAFGIDLTPAEVLGCNLHVCRSFVPGLHPLGSGTGNEHGDLRRLARFARKMGLPEPTSINLDPHPFP